MASEAGPRPRRTSLGARQAERLFQLSCGYMICRSDPDPYKALRAKGYVEDSTRRWRGDIEYETGQNGPRVTQEGMAALRAYVDRNGPLEIEVTPLMAHYKQILRMEPTPKPGDVA
jgi:hypothetical protein